MKTGHCLRSHAHALTLLLGLLGYVIAATPALGLPIDTKIGAAQLANSGDATELAELATLLGVDPSTLVFDFKITTSNPASIALVNTPEGGWTIDAGLNRPDYFMLKFGIGGTGATADHFYFQNSDDFTHLVWTNDQVQNLTGGNCGARNQNACNIGRLSHYAGFNRATVIHSGSVPEPSGALLFGMAALTMAIRLHRRRQTK